MTGPVEWITEIAQAADDLQYGVRRIEPGRIVLFAHSKDQTKVTIESVLLNGPLLRRVLRHPHDQDMAGKENPE